MWVLVRLKNPPRGWEVFFSGFLTLPNLCQVSPDSKDDGTSSGGSGLCPIPAERACLRVLRRFLDCSNQSEASGGKALTPVTSRKPQKGSQLCFRWFAALQLCSEANPQCQSCQPFSTFLTRTDSTDDIRLNFGHGHGPKQCRSCQPLSTFLTRTDSTDDIRLNFGHGHGPKQCRSCQPLSTFLTLTDSTDDIRLNFGHGHGPKQCQSCSLVHLSHTH